MHMQIRMRKITNKSETQTTNNFIYRNSSIA
jgi:hypothetical protein